MLKGLNSAFRRDASQFRLRSGSARCREALNVALIVGGSITIPHLRRAVVALEEISEGK